MEGVKTINQSAGGNGGGMGETETDPLEKSLLCLGPCLMRRAWYSATSEAA